jgi:hypothetical protein
MSPLTEPTRLTLKQQSVAPLLLDTYSGAAAAYSLRNLSWAYGGPVVRVRRSSDNTEQDFTAIQVTDGTLTTFCGAGDGFVRTWYDQSGNESHLVQSTTGSQPKIVNSGSLEMYLGKATINLAESSSLVASKGVFGLPVFSSYFVRNTSDTKYIEFSQSGGNSHSYLSMQGNGGTGLLSNFGSPSLYVNSSITTPTTADQVYQSLNGYKLSAVIGATTSAWTSFRLGGYTEYGGYQFAASLFELVIYGASTAASRTGIEANINAHYAIY